MALKHKTLIKIYRTNRDGESRCFACGARLKLQRLLAYFFLRQTKPATCVSDPDLLLAPFTPFTDLRSKCLKSMCMQ